jgi:hypothetical protein
VLNVPNFHLSPQIIFLVIHFLLASSENLLKKKNFRKIKHGVKINIQGINEPKTKINYKN